MELGDFSMSLTVADLARSRGFYEKRGCEADVGVTFASKADETIVGPAGCVIIDPDGNSILLDQHV